MKVGEAPASRGPILLFDDACGFCSSAVQMVLRHDKRGSLRFAPLRGAYGTSLRSRHPELDSVTSLVWVFPGDAVTDDRILIRSDAAIHVANYIGGVFKLALIARLVPRRLRDAAYDAIARRRHKLSRTSGKCIVPAAGQRDRFLD